MHHVFEIFIRVMLRAHYGAARVCAEPSAGCRPRLFYRWVGSPCGPLLRGGLSTPTRSWEGVNAECTGSPMGGRAAEPLFAMEDLCRCLIGGVRLRAFFPP
jgi:hypothetical protein